MLLRTWLAKAGYRVQEAQDGQEAWEHFVAAQNRSPFSVVLTDIIMPRMDGLELVEKIRKTDPDVPVLILSSVEDAETAKKALHLHVNEFLMKPFDSQALVAALERLLTEGLSRTQKEHLQETTQAVRMAHKVMEAVPEQELPIFSICEPLKEAGGDVFRTIRRPDGTILFLLADVAGHSVMSSYAVASFLGMLSTFLQEDPHVASLFQRLNRSIQEGPFPDIPIATLAASWSPRMGRFHVINAGIPYGLWQRKSLNRTEAIALDGAPLGLLDQPRTNEKVLVLEPGDRLFFATDGLFDVASKTKQPFRELAAAQWQGLVDAPVAQALGNLCEAARIHGNGVIGDDLLAIALEQPTWTSLENEFNRSIPSSPDAIEQVCAEFETFLKQQPATLDLDKSRRFEIQLAFREALSNAHRHGNKGELRERIAIHACLKAHSLDIRVVDAGRGFKLEPARTQPDAIREGGRGIPILQSTTKLLRMHAGELELQMDLNGEADGREN
jgi:serine phosphatase RsbU (regulator of sigma subunit)/anti-sigma regulatory factor (Ser/Thr protein kinase)